MATVTLPRPGFRPSPYLVGAGAALVAALIYAVYLKSTLGHAAFNTTNYGVFWGLPIVAYDYFLLTSTGLTLLASLPLTLGLRELDPIGKRCIWLALAALVGGVGILFMELAHPLRALWAAPLNAQTNSPLFWKILCVGAYTVVLVVLVLGFARGTPASQISWPLAALGTLLALAITLIAGSVYGMMIFRPFWYGGELPVAFLIESFMGGIAFFVFFTYLIHGFSPSRIPQRTRELLAGRLGGLVAAAIFLHILFVLSRTAAGLWSYGEGLQVWRHTVSQPLYWAALVGGGLTPLVIFGVPALRARSWLQIPGALLVALGLLASRYEFLISGQLLPPFKGSWAPSPLEYVPSQFEWSLFVVGVFLANTVYAALESWSSTKEP